MRALTVQPGVANSLQLETVPDPTSEEGHLLVRALALGICGTDAEIVSGQYGRAPPGEKRLILGHESLGRIEEAPPDSGFASGDIVVGVVRRPDPVPCANCAIGEWDMCLNGLYTERGIKERHGYGAEWYRLDPAYAVRVDPPLGLLGVLLEPTSIVAKAWHQIDVIGHRSRAWAPRKVLVTGAGPVGLLAAMMGHQRGLDVHVFDRTVSGTKPEVVQALGGTYHSRNLADLESLRPDIILECTGAPTVIVQVITQNAPTGIVCLAGVSSGSYRMDLDIGRWNRTMVLQNDVVLGSVNANLDHYRAAANALDKADKAWLSRLISRRVSLNDWSDAFMRRPDDIKVVIDFTL